MKVTKIIIYISKYQVFVFMITSHRCPNPLHLVFFLIVATSFLGVLFSYSTIPISAQQDTMLHDTQTKKSVTHKAIGHESHQVVEFVDLKDNILYNGSITFKSSIPVDVIVYNDTSTTVDKTNTNNTNIKPWKIEEKNLFQQLL